MRKIMLLGLLLTGLQAFSQKTDFSGKWQVDTTRIAFGQAPKFVLPTAVDVTQDKSKIVIGRTVLDENNSEKKYSETLAFDGTPSDITTFLGRKRHSAGTWSNDSEFKLDCQQSTAEGTPGSKITEVWTLEDGGKTLIINRHVEQADGFKYDMKGVYSHAG